MKRFIPGPAALLLCALFYNSAIAQIPQRVSYQGILTDNASESTVPDGNYSMTLTMYAAPTGGTALWAETIPAVPISGGLFDVLLGGVTPLKLAFDRPYWLGVAINGGVEMTPRTPLSAAPYSYRSAWADSAAAVALNAISTGNIRNGAVTPAKIDATGSTAGQVLRSDGTVASWGPASAAGVSTLNTLSGDVEIIPGPSTSVTRVGNKIRVGLLGGGVITSINSADAAIGVTDPTGPGVSLSINSLGITTPLIGNQAVTPSKISPTGAASGQSLIFNGTSVIWGNPLASGLILPFDTTLSNAATLFSITNSGTGGSGSFAINNPASSTNALRGTTDGTGSGVLGVHSAATGIAAGVRGESNSQDGNATGIVGAINSTTPGGFSSGVRGINSGTGGLGIGVYGSQGGSGWGVYGTTPTGIGVHGNSTSGFGLYGLSTGGTGVYGLSTNGESGRFEVTTNTNNSNALSGITNGGGVAVYGASSGTGRAGYFQINNAANAFPALEASSNGSGPAVSGTNTGTGRGGLFQVTSTTNGSVGLEALTMGTGGAGQFTVNNAANTANALTSTTSGTGRAVLGRRGAGSGVSLAQTEAIRGDNTDGPGVAGTANTAVGVYGTSTASHGMWGVSVTAATAGVLGRNDVVNGFGVWGQSFGGGTGVYGTSQTGHAGQFDITNAPSTGDAVRANQSGLGRGVYSIINNTSNIVAAVRGETNGGGYGIFGQATGTGNAGFFQVSNPASTSSTVNVTTNGIGSGITVQLTNASNGARGIDVLQAGVGPGVFATSAGGNAIWGITSSISAAGVLGQNTFGEAVVGINNGGTGIGAVVGRNDSSGYGVRGFNTDNGIGVLGQAGISGGTGVGGRFENVNAANGSDALQAATNGTGWAGNFTNSTNSSATRGVRISTTAGQGGNALTIANGTVALSHQHPYASNTVVDDAVLVVTTAGNVTVPTGPPLVDGATVWVVNNSGAVITITNTTAGAFNINPGLATQFLFVSTVSGTNWIPVQ